MKNIRNFLLSIRELRRLSVAGGGIVLAYPPSAGCGGIGRTKQPRQMAAHEQGGIQWMS